MDDTLSFYTKCGANLVFAFDGAEGGCFWVNCLDKTEDNEIFVKVSFDQAQNIDNFLSKWLKIVKESKKENKK